MDDTHGSQEQDRLMALLQQVEQKKGNDLSTRELEDLQAYITQEQQTGFDAWTDASRTINRILVRRYKALSENSKQLVLAVDRAAEANLPEVAQLTVEKGTSVGDINLLTQDVRIVENPFADVLIRLAHDLIRLTGGTVPQLGVRQVSVQNTVVPRMVASWQVKRALTVEELHSIYQLTREAYDRDVAGYRATSTGWQVYDTYRNFRGKAAAAGDKGIYFGPSQLYFGAANGVFVHRKFKDATEANYLHSNHPLDFLGYAIRNKPITTLVEFRDSGRDQYSHGLVQDMFLMFTVQISYLLAKGRLIDGPTLMTTIFRELNRIGTRHIRRDMLYGMSDILEVIERCLLLPLQKPELARKYELVPESILLAGVPGIGKTFLEQYLMLGDYNAIFAAIDSDRLAVDLAESAKDSSAILLRIDRITELTTLPVILIIDDIDVILRESEMISKFLNMMQGIRQRGLYVLASTNHPEKIDLRLLEPGRLSTVIHVGLPSDADRRGVLKKYLNLLPFASAAVREAVLEQETQATVGWTQRYLWKLTVEAKRFRAMKVDRDEADECLASDDFIAARAHLEQTVNFREVAAWDRRIAEFVARAKANMGFGQE